MGVKNIVSYLNRNRIFTHDGGRWGIGQVHRILTRRIYKGEHDFNKRAKSKALNPESEVVIVPVPPIIERETFDAVQALPKARHPTVGRHAVKPQMLSKFARSARKRIRLGGGGYRRDHLRALAQRVELAEGEHRIEVSAAPDAGSERQRKSSAHSGIEVAEKEGFEPSDPLRDQRFSRPSH